MTQTLLHGTLRVIIYEADKLPGGERPHSRELMETVQEAVGIGGGVSKLYAAIDLEKARVGRTRILENEHSNPRWYESFRIYCAHLASNVVFTVKDDNPIGATLIGRAYVPVEDLLGGEEIDRWLDILDPDQNPIHGDSKIHVKLQYFDIMKDRNGAQGFGSKDCNRSTFASRYLKTSCPRFPESTNPKEAIVDEVNTELQALEEETEGAKRALNNYIKKQEEDEEEAINQFQSLMNQGSQQ